MKPSNTRIRILAAAWLATCLIAPMAARAEVELVQKFLETTNNPGISRKGGFIHAFPITWRGEYVYVATHYEGYINIFKRDLATGKLVRLDALSFDDAKDMSIDDFTWAGNRRVALYQRDPVSSQIRFVELLDVTPGNLVFEPDGTIGYSSDGLWVLRDPKTGKLAPDGCARDVGEARPYQDAENGYIYGGCWARQQLTVMKTGKKTPAEK